MFLLLVTYVIPNSNTNGELLSFPGLSVPYDGKQLGMGLWSYYKSGPINMIWCYFLFQF